MKNKNLYIGLGVLAVAGIGFYMWRKKDKAEDASEAGTKTADASKTAEAPATTPSSSTSETPAKSTTSSATGNVASNAGYFLGNRFVPTRTIVSPRKNVVAQAVALDTLTKTNIGNIDVVPNKIAVVPVGTVGVGTVGSNDGGNVIPVGRIKSWGGRMLGEKKQCYDESQSKYVDCPVQASNTGL